MPTLYQVGVKVAPSAFRSWEARSISHRTLIWSCETLPEQRLEFRDTRRWVPDRLTSPRSVLPQPNNGRLPFQPHEVPSAGPRSQASDSTRPGAAHRSSANEWWNSQTVLERDRKGTAGFIQPSSAVWRVNGAPH